MIQQTENTTYYLLDSHQGLNPNDGWRAQQLQNLQISPEGLRLSALPTPPLPLKDAEGTFGGLENPTGVAVDSDGTIYVSDSKKHHIFKIVKRDGFQPRAHFFRVSKGPFANDQFVYIPAANRLERWPLSHEPHNFSEVEVICKTVWNETHARKEVLSFVKTKESEVAKKECKKLNDAEDKTTETAAIEKEWEGNYPQHLPAGEICKTPIEYLPCLGGLGSGPRQFNEPRGLAISPAGYLYVADSKNHRVQVFALRGLILKEIWGKCAGAVDIRASLTAANCLPQEDKIIRFGQPIAGQGKGEFNEPWDVAADSKGNVYIADKGNHRLQKYDCQTRKFSEIDGTILSAHFFQALYGSQSGERFVFIPARQRLEKWPKGGEPLNINGVNIISKGVHTIDKARKLVLKAIGADGAKDILVEWDMAYPKNLEADQPFVSPTHLAADLTGRVYAVDQEKDYVRILNRHGHILGHVTYAGEMGGHFKPTAVAIDSEGKLLLASSSGIHRFNLEKECCFYEQRCAALRGHCAGMASDAKGHLFAIDGGQGGIVEIPSPVGFEKSGYYISRPIDSQIDRCQWHKVLLEFATEIPIGASITVWTYTSQDSRTMDDISALPDEEWKTGQINAKDFLILSPPGRYLWLKIEFKGNGIATPVLRRLKAHFPRLTYMQYLPAVYQADPVSKDFLERFLSIFETAFSGIEDRIDNFWRYLDPDGVPEDFLPWLAGWVDMAFDRSWPLEVRRNLLRNASELYCLRGTPAGLKKMLQLALGVEVKILEHFQLRRWLFLASQSTLGNRSQLWGNSIVKRLQLDENSTIGDFALVGTGDPVHDPFHVYAHKFSVFVPASSGRSERAERMLRLLIENEKPAHTEYALCKVEPRFRIGVQSTIGFDTLVGCYPRMVLNHCATLGHDALLSHASDEKRPAALKVGKGARIGVNAVVG